MADETTTTDGNGTKRVGVDALLGGEPPLEPAGSSPPRLPPVPASAAVPAMPPDPQTLRVPIPPPPAPRQQRQPRARYMDIQVGGDPGAGLPLARRSFSMAFKSNEGKVLVYRVDADNREQILPNSWPASYLAAHGLTESGIESFLLQHVAPDWGGGTYIVRGLDQNGNKVGEALIEVAGPSKDGPRSATSGGPPPGVDPGAWADAVTRIRRSDTPPAEKPKSIADALSEIQQMKTAEALIGGGKVAQLEKTVEDLKARLEASAAAPPPMPAPSGGAVDDIDRLLKLQQLVGGGGRSAAVDPAIAALTEQMKALANQVSALTAQRAEEERKSLQQEIKELRDKLDGKNNIGRLESLKQEVAEIQEVANTLSPPTGGATFADFATKMAEAWTPGAIGALIEQKAAADERVAFAKARAALAVKSGRAPQRQLPEPPLRRHIPESQRNALMEATDAADLKNQVEQLIFRLISIGDESVTKHLRLVLESVAKEERDRTTILVARLVQYIYGQTDAAKALVLRITESLYTNREELLGKFADGGGEGEGAEEEDTEDEGEVEDGEEEPEKPAVDTTAKPVEKGGAAAEGAAEGSEPPAPTSEPKKPSRKRGR